MMDSNSSPHPHRWQRYPKYKPSGVEWLGQVPEEWEIKKITWITKCLDGKRIPLNTEERGKKQGEYPYWGANAIVDYINDWLFNEPLVLLGEDGAPFFEKFKDVAFAVDGKIWVNNHTHVLRPKKIHYKFLAYALNSVDYRPYINGATRDKLTQSEMNSIHIQCPPSLEQHVIANFLDDETVRIDALIEKKERQIKLLQEKKVDLISQAVTKGLDPNAKMKDSGIEWLGEVPVGWAIGRLKFYCSVNPSKSEIGFLPDDLEVNFLPMENLGEDHSLCLDLIKPLSEVWNGYTYFKENDVILAKITPCFENGKCSVCSGLKNKIGFGTTELHVLRALNSIIPRFCYYIVQNHAFKSIGTELMFGTTGQKRLPDSYVKDYKQGIPPIPEQHAIAVFLDRETVHIDDIIDKINGSIEKLQEYRSALISAAVTGKIDLRQKVSA